MVEGEHGDNSEESARKPPPVIRALAAGMGGLAVLNGGLGSTVFILAPEQEYLSFVFLSAFVFWCVLLLLTLRGSEGGRRAVLALSTFGLLGQLAFSAFTMLLITDNKAAAPAMLGWSLLGAALLAVTVHTMRRDAVQRWTSPALFDADE